MVSEKRTECILDSCSHGVHQVSSGDDESSPARLEAYNARHPRVRLAIRWLNWTTVLREGEMVRASQSRRPRCHEVLILIGEWPKGTEIDEGEGGLMKGAEVGDNEGQCVCPFSWKEESEE